MPAALSFLTECAGLGAMFGALVAMPAPAAPGRVERLRSPAWALVLPGILVVGTFGMLVLPTAATWLAALATVATPALAGIAVVAVARAPRHWLLLVPAAVLLAALAVVLVVLAARPRSLVEIRSGVAALIVAHPSRFR